MSKLKNTLFVFVALSAFMVTPALAQSGCKNGKFVGSYVRSMSVPDVWGDGSGIQHTYVYQLDLTSDGLGCYLAARRRRVLAAGSAVRMESW